MEGDCEHLREEGKRQETPVEDKMEEEALLDSCTLSHGRSRGSNDPCSEPPKLIFQIFKYISFPRSRIHLVMHSHDELFFLNIAHSSSIAFNEKNVFIDAVRSQYYAAISIVL